MKNGWLIAALLLALPAAIGCHSGMGKAGCAGGACGLLGGGCSGGGCGVGEVSAESNYQPNQGRGGPLGTVLDRHYRGPQSHTGGAPSPAMGPSSPTVTYPYYTTRGPRDFLNPNPPSIGR